MTEHSEATLASLAFDVFETFRRPDGTLPEAIRFTRVGTSEVCAQGGFPDEIVPAIWTVFVNLERQEDAESNATGRPDSGGTE